jgi:hypothetical protein
MTIDIRALSSCQRRKLFLSCVIYLCTVPAVLASIFAEAGTECRYPAFSHPPHLIRMERGMNCGLRTSCPSICMYSIAVASARASSHFV